MVYLHKVELSEIIFYLTSNAEFIIEYSSFVTREFFKRDS